MAYFNVDLSPKTRAMLDQEARRRLSADKPMSRYKWLTTTPEGRQVFNETAMQPEWKSKPIEEVNDYIRQRYVEATGGLTKGRPQLALTRAKIIEEAVLKLLGAV
jgi:hypothetical protein